ncbi:tetratricopeptide repeat protein [Sphingomonas sp. So64.6b]|uniref:tetratricopeptide repeat protein n=1 Tax=Sphingomonas sp. So64.6b TaxID=2997354 RepID=UPI001601D276|nr:tetratricopeptide repeat protein [Sphingomonas sp. So64.6b]QNA84146.1 tetratricopeptide repeat protein [Sphingomonas sp. So64.6b]
MKTRALFTVGMSALALGGTVFGGAMVQGGVATASTRSATNGEKQAAKEVASARKALAKGKYDQAVVHAEAAVGFGPQVVSYRMVLAQSYLKAGRFTSARQSFTDVLALDPSNGGAALQLALAQIAEGNWDGARRTLDANASIIPASDRGLAVALAGDPGAAVEILTVAARTPDADAKTRQNLALALALAGRWQDAKTLVAVDVAPGEVDKRIMQWASFARPTSASDQVAALLGVTPAQDAGQPVALALNMASGTALASKDPAPIDTFMPGTPANAVAVAADMGTPVPPSIAAPETSVASVAAPASYVSFGPRQEMLQAIPARVAAVKSEPRMTPGAIVPQVARVVVAKPKPVVGAAVAPRAAAKGNFFIQLGAFDSAAVAKDAWSRIARRNESFGAHTPSGMPIKSGAGSFYRLSVGGFAREDATALCRSYKAKGGSCFVRASAGDQVASWVKAR